MKRDRGFLLVDVLVAIGLLATALTAAFEVMRNAHAAERRAIFREASAACAENIMAATLAGNAIPEAGCSTTLRVEMESALPLGDVEQVTWTLSSDNFPTETLTVLRRAQ